MEWAGTYAKPATVNLILIIVLRFRAGNRVRNGTHSYYNNGAKLKVTLR
jgi:hypothetical protein